jgi:hypothetical protein
MLLVQVDKATMMPLCHKISVTNIKWVLFFETKREKYEDYTKLSVIRSIFA